ncbi:MAG: SLC13 family permease [Xanthobacteraceae bacterium]
MYGMPLSQALVFVFAVILIIGTTQRRYLHPFVAIVVVTAAFGYVAGFTTSVLTQNFGGGFAAMMYSPGLVIVAAGFISGLAETTRASDRLAAKLVEWQKRWPWLSSDKIAACLGLVAGIGAVPASAFALLTPLLRPIAGESAKRHESGTISLALAISASHGLVWLTPVPIAAAAILGAEWQRVALFGFPLAVLLTGFGAVFARRQSMIGAADQSSPPPPASAPEVRPSGSPLVLILAITVPLLLLMVQSLGDIPSEPLGGGPTRELILGIGRPLILFLLGVGIMVAGNPRIGFRCLGDSAWTTDVFGKVANILLIVCAAGGLQRICQETGMAEMFGERLLSWHAAALGGVLVAFLTAAAIKSLQGSSLVAAITAAGMVQPLLLPLGLDDPTGKALAALAVGAGAMTVCHVNDEFFWLVANRARLRPLRAFATIGLGTLLQGLIAAAALCLLALLFSHA